jgi:hypothetical protein
MQELGIGLVNAQAAEITDLTYPDLVERPEEERTWLVVGKVGQDDDGYDLYEIERQGEKTVVPANRLVFVKRMLSRLA